MKYLAPVVFLAWAWMAAPPAKADIMTLTSGNSTLKVDPKAPRGVLSWVVDGAELLYERWFWLRTGADQKEYELIPPHFRLDVARTSANKAGFQYTGGGLTVQLSLTLTGGPVGSLVSDLMQSIKITNSSLAPIELNFFHYADIDLGGSETARFLSPNAVEQIGSTPRRDGVYLNQTIVDGAGLAHHQAAGGSAILDSLNDAGITTLTDADDARGDGNWALQWGDRLGPGQSLLISEDLNISDPPVSVPESPASTIILLTGALAGCALLRRDGLLEAGQGVSK